MKSTYSKRARMHKDMSLDCMKALVLAMSRGVKGKLYNHSNWNLHSVIDGEHIIFELSCDAEEDVTSTEDQG